MFAPLIDISLGSIMLRSAAAQYQLTKIAETDRRSPMRVPLHPRSRLAPAFIDALPDWIKEVPGLWILLAQPFPLLWPWHRHIKPDRSSIGIGTGINHMMVKVESTDKLVPIPWLL